MPSPFPGMNPYLEHEDAWHNFHEQFPAAAVAALVPQVGPNYYVKVDDHVFIHELPEGQRRNLLGIPDVNIGERRFPREPGIPATPAAAVCAPRLVRLPAVETLRLSYVEIRDRRNRRVVTVIELLSPSNKDPNQDRDQYEAKRATVLASHTNLVEIDLLRGGPRMPLASPTEGDYGVLVSRYVDRPDAGWWPIGLRERLPSIPIPLNDDDPVPTLDLQAILHRLYDDGGYERFMYDSDPSPPLRPDDAEWAKQFVPEWARR